MKMQFQTIEGPASETENKTTRLLQHKTKRDFTAAQEWYNFTAHHSIKKKLNLQKIRRLLSKQIIKSVGLLLKIPSFLQPVKNDLELNTPGVYNMPCKCGQV
jgi:hypothetical protein